ncbi:MAG: COG1470 family protein [Candidatus Helarchaeota archaeon]
MSWICITPGITCLCPSPVEAVKSGVISIIDAVKEGVTNIQEAAESAVNFVGNKASELKANLGEVVDRISDISGEFFELYLAPILEKIKEWVKFLFETILNGANTILKTLSDAVFDASKWIYKRIFEVALGLKDFGEIAREILNTLLGLMGTNLDDAGSYIKNTEPFKTIMPLFETLQKMIEILEEIANPQKLLQDLMDEHIRPVVVNYFKELLPLEKIPIPDVEDLVLNVAYDNIFNIGPLFGDPTAGLSKSMERIVEWLIKISMNKITDAKPESGSDVSDWSWDVLALLLTLEGIVVGFVTLHPAFPSAGGATKVGQVGTALTIIGILLGEMNIINSLANTATSGKFDKELEEYMNGVKAGKDLVLSNSTAMVLTCAGLVIQLTGGATPYEYIATALSFLTSIGGLLCAIGAGNIQSDPILLALSEIYEENYGREGRETQAGVVEGAKRNLLPADPRVEELYADYKEPAMPATKPVITVDVPWYGPKIINYCFTNREYARQVASDFIDEMGNVKGMWMSVRVRNTGLASARIRVSFFYSIDDGPLQSIQDVTRESQQGDNLNPRETLDYWFQEWNLSRSDAADLCRGRYKLIAVVAVEGPYEEEKSILRNSVEIRIPPHFEIEPLTLASSGPIGTKQYKNSELPLIREGDLITLSSKIRNTGGKFESFKKLWVRWYIDDGAGKLLLISKQAYGSPEGGDILYGEEIPIALELETTNLGLSSYGIEGWVRHIKVALSKSDFEDCFGENLPLFSNKQEQEIYIAFQPPRPEFTRPLLTVNNRNPTEGEIIKCSCKIHNAGEGPVNFRNGILKLEELAVDGRTKLKSHKPPVDFSAVNFEIVKFDAGDSNLGQECEKISYDFIPPTDMWIDAIKIKPQPGATSNVICSRIKIIYLGYVIATLGEKDLNSGIHFFENPIFLETGKIYHFEFEGIDGHTMIASQDYRFRNREIILNGVITIDSDNFIHAHPKFQLFCLKSLPPGGEGQIDYNLDTTGSVTTGFLAWTFNSETQNISFSEKIAVDIRERKIQGFNFKCDSDFKEMGPIPVLEFPVKITKEDDVQEITVKLSVSPPQKNAKQYFVYLREPSSKSSSLVDTLILSLSDSTPKVFIAGIVASKKIPKRVTTGFKVKGVAQVEGKKIEKVYEFRLLVGSDFTEIFDIHCDKNQQEVIGQPNVEYIIMLYNKTREHLSLHLQAEGESQVIAEKWDYYFTKNRKKELNLDLLFTPEDFKFTVLSKSPTESFSIINTIKACYSWDPLGTGNPDYSLEKRINLHTQFQEKPFPLALVFRVSPNAADPGTSVKLSVQCTIFPSVEKAFYNVMFKLEGNLEFVTSPNRVIQIERGQSQIIEWEARIPETAETGSTIPVKVSAAIPVDPRKISILRDIKITNYRKDYEFALKTDWRILSVIKGKEATLKISLENTGRKTDRIKLQLSHNLPTGWLLRPKGQTIYLKPDEKQTIRVLIGAPLNSTVGQGGNLVITAISKGNPNVLQRKVVLVKAAAPGPKWSIQLDVEKRKQSISSSGTAQFQIVVMNNGNRQLGEVKLSIQHKYQPFQFETQIIPDKLNLREAGTSGTARAIIKPQITGPGTYRFNLIAQWYERILKVKDSEQLQIDYATQVFLKSKFGIITIGAAIGLIITVILLLRFII